jgi:hypothetical protein
VGFYKSTYPTFTSHTFFPVFPLPAPTPSSQTPDVLHRFLKLLPILVRLNLCFSSLIFDLLHSLDLRFPGKVLARKAIFDSLPVGSQFVGLPVQYTL